MDDTDRLLERHLVLRCQLGDDEAFRELHARCDRPLRYFVARLLRDDGEAAEVVQEVWLTVFRRVSTLAHPEAFRSWLYRIAHAASVDAVRRGTARSRAERAYADWPVESDAPPDVLAVRRLHQAIERLDDAHRAVMVLLLVGELDVTEIAQALSLPVGTVKSRAHYARRQLKEWLGERHE